MKQAFCTITTLSHWKYTVALAKSVQQFLPDVMMHVLVTDATTSAALPQPSTAGIKIYDLQDLQMKPFVSANIQQYGRHSDRLRWSLKPVFMHYLLHTGTCEAVFYADNDLYFFENPAFLFDVLENHSILLCPHWRIKDPAINADWFRVNFTDGVYNAGFVGATRQGMDALTWWKEACLYACEKNRSKGFFDDQKYLDLLPAAFEGVGIIHHRGCNVAYWNKTENKREAFNGQVMINGLYPVVFIHFTANLEWEVKAGRYEALRPYYEHYVKALEA